MAFRGDVVHRPQSYSNSNSNSYSVLDKAGKAKDLERYVVVAINSENKG